MAMVWAGSQVTKLVRIGGYVNADILFLTQRLYLVCYDGCRAVALAPIVDRGLSWFTVKYKFESQGKVSHPILL